MTRCRVVGFEDDLDAHCAGLGKQVDAGGEYVAGKSSSLVIVFGAHGFDETRGGLGVVPEQTVRCVVVVAVENEQIEVGAIERCLEETLLDVGSTPFDHVMRTQHRVEATEQLIVVMQWADRWPGVCSQPTLDQPVFLDGEAMAEQHLTQNVIGTVDLEFDGFKPGRTGVSKPTLDDMCNPIGSCVGHDDRVESYPVAPVGCDHCGFWATEVIEPEELTEIVG